MPSYTEHTLEPRLLQAVQEISGELLRDADVSVVSDIIRDSLVLRLEKYIMCEKVAEDQYEIVEEPVWRNPQAHYVASLPDGFRKRFLMYFWGLSEYDLTPRRVTHTVTLRRWVKLPDVPSSMGRAYVEQTLDYESGWA